jgi:hypothetical protein
MRGLRDDLNRNGVEPCLVRAGVKIQSVAVLNVASDDGQVALQLLFITEADLIAGWEDSPRAVGLSPTAAWAASTKEIYAARFTCDCPPKASRKNQRIIDSNTSKVARRLAAVNRPVTPAGDLADARPGQQYNCD